MRKLVKAPAPVASHQPVGKSIRHDSADQQVAGLATFIDDKIMRADGLFAYPVCAPISKGHCRLLNLNELHASADVVIVLTADDIPGINDVGPVFAGDPLLAETTILYHAQPVALIVATSHRRAQQVARSAKFDVESEAPLLDPEVALAQSAFVRPPHAMQRGNPDPSASRHHLHSSLYIGGQEHFYLEGQVALAEPLENSGMMIYSSSQHPSEVQKLVAEVLNIRLAEVTVEMRRMGGAFGGKETQAAHWACLAALAAHYTQQPVKLRLSRTDDMKLTGKRHPFSHDYHIGFSQQGLIEHVVATINGHCGHSADLSDAIVDRAMFHADNAYYYPKAQITGNRLKLNTHSHTAFRGFGGPQGMVLAETIMDDIAYHLGQNPLTIRQQNLYREGFDTTVYGQKIEQPILADLIQQLADKAEYAKRYAEITAFNAQSPIIKKGLALTPVKFGISFTKQHLNQAGALVHIYTDGSVHLNHGGTEMGQGLNTKVAQIVAEVFGISLEAIHISATRTDKVPNTSPTAASSGADLNGMAAFNAANILKKRLIDFLSAHFNCKENTDFYFNNSTIQFADKQFSFAEVAQMAYEARVSLSTTGFYKTPKIYYDREQAKGRPFFYFAHGAALSEVEIDTLTGENRLQRVDILHDVGQSLNPALDKGQIEGAFIQGMGWLTTEELCWNEQGELTTHSPATYKIPSIGDTPSVFNVDFYPANNPENTVFRSKAVGEPPFMLAISVLSALRNAIASINDYQYAPPLNPPATVECILLAVEQAKKYRAQKDKPCD